MSLDRVILQVCEQLWRPWAVRRARASEQQLRLAGQHEAAAFEAKLRLGPSSTAVPLGEFMSPSGERYLGGLSVSELVGQHGLITGASGGGKSFFYLGVQGRVLEAPRVATVLIDMKGETADATLNLQLPALAAAGKALPDPIRVIRPFGDDVPLLRLTDPEPGVSPEIQAEAIGDTLCDAVGGELGVRMRNNLVTTAQLAIELGEPLTQLEVWLRNPAVLARASRRSARRALRDALADGLASESKESLRALAARLSRFFLHARLALNAPGCLHFADCLESGLTVIDLGNVPAGCETAARFWAQALVGRLCRAVLSRTVHDDSPQAWIVGEEFQEALAPASALQFGRVVALSRSRRTGFWFICQQMAQVARVDPHLVRVLRTNCDLEVAFRANFEDAKAWAHALPVPDDIPRAGQWRNRLAGEMTRLPRREGWLWCKQQGLRAQRMRSLHLAMDELRRLADACPQELREQIARGTVSVPRAELEAKLEGEERRTATAPILEFPDPPAKSTTTFPRLG